MPINSQTEIEFIQRLYREGRIGLDAVYGIFYKTRKSWRPETLKTILLSHYADGESGELIVVERGCDTPVNLQNETVLANPERYDVVYNRCAHTECSIISMLLGRLLFETSVEDGVYAEVISAETVLIQGDPEVALEQIRRLEGFTNYVGNLIIQRRFNDLSALFWNQEDENNTPEALADTYAELECKYGRFELFSNTNVFLIYSGDDRGRKHFDEMKVPKGVRRDQRVGASGFSLASSITPNGIPRWELSVYLEVVETDRGEFRITQIKWQYTY